MEYLVKENVWINKSLYEKAETEYHENLAKAPVTPLAGEVAKARQLLIQSRDSFKNDCSNSVRSSVDVGALKFFEKKVVEFEKSIKEILGKLDDLESRVVVIEKGLLGKTETPKSVSKNDNDDDDVDLFGSDSEEESETVAKIREERLAAYNAKKSKKPALIAKSNVILDIKPWDDETNMKEMENAVRKIETDGLLWGAAKLVPLAYGIHKLQISCVVEDEKVSIDWLQEELQSLEDYVQSVDIAAFNKI